MHLPDEFLASTNSLLGDGEDLFLAALSGEPPVSIRLNPYKTKRNPLLISPDMLDGEVGWSRHGRYLKNRPAFTFDPLFHAGYYYVQEASSMFIEHVVQELVKSPVRCLDLCASPGGKSIGLRSALPHGSLLVSNEIVRSRANVLSENLLKFGHPDVLVSNNPPEDFSRLPQFFDLMLVDAPCSGEGMFRKDAGAIAEWSGANVTMCAARQRKILSDGWRSLKPGGILIYSTCTYNLRENEENMRWMMREFGAETISVPVVPSWNITPSFFPDVEAYRFFPHKTKGEGLFVSVLRKPEGADGGSGMKNKKRLRPFWKEVSPFSRWLRWEADFCFMERGAGTNAVSRNLVDTYAVLLEKLNVVSFGIELGMQKGRDFVPSHALSMSIALDSPSFPAVELSYGEVLAYLRNEALHVDAQRGFMLLKYANEPLGFVKNIGNRANNLYPQEWRIRSKTSPDKMEGFFIDAKRED